MLLVAGDKSGGSARRFYRDAHPQGGRALRSDTWHGSLRRKEDHDARKPVRRHDCAKLDPERRRRIEERAAELIAEEMTLRELRKARQLTQARVAAELGISQDGVSRLEQRTDLLLSTLRKTVEAMGGSLSLIAKFPDRPPVELAGIAEGDPRD